MNNGGGAEVLVLSGGGVLGAAQSGMLEVLHATGWRPDVIVGVSAGALNGAVIANDSSSGVCGPKFIVPRHSSLTWRAVRPSRR